MAHKAAGGTGEWDELGETRGGRHFGRWWASQRSTLTDEGVEVGVHFIGHDGRYAVEFDGIDAAREFASQLAAAIEYAERELTGATPRV
ncbi:hypothetical protein [Demequina sp.]|uniref:hypothetical protein n=1 Tax=Demequina sp. TaxID=2050685 RepID=UPI003D0F4B7C